MCKIREYAVASRWYLYIQNHSLNVITRAEALRWKETSLVGMNERIGIALILALKLNVIAARACAT